MSFVKELILFGLYFLLLSTTLQSEDAFVFFQNSQTPDPDQQQPSRGQQLFIFLVFSTLCFITLLVTPYLNLNLRKLSIGACLIIIAKYICQIATYAHSISVIMELAALVLDVIGQSLFYLTSIRVVQAICEKHNTTDQSGRLFAVFAALYAFSIVLGYAISYGCYEKLPTWSYLIILTCMSALSGIICYFTFPNQTRDVIANELHQERQEPSPAAQPVQPNPPNPPRRAPADNVYRDGISLKEVFNTTVVWYQKMLLIIGMQTTLGFLIPYGYKLIEYLVWTTQSDSELDKLIHNVDVMLVFGGGAIFASIFTGILCDFVSMKKMGYGIMFINCIVFCFLYIGISVKTISTTLILYILVGICTFSLGTWLLCACSKIYGGKFESFSVNIQFIGVAGFLYQMGSIEFEGRIDEQLKLSLQLGLLLITAIISVLFLKKLPSGQLEVMFEQSQIESQPSQRQEEPKVQVQMTPPENSTKIEAQLQKKQAPPLIDQDYLL